MNIFTNKFFVYQFIINGYCFNSSNSNKNTEINLHIKSSSKVMKPGLKLASFIMKAKKQQDNHIIYKSKKIDLKYDLQFKTLFAIFNIY